MSRCFIDTEFNGFGGALISMALVSDTGSSWYRVLECPDPIDPWVAENVMPKLGMYAVPREEFRISLKNWLVENHTTTVVADWPSDLVHFYREIMGSDHSQTLSMPIGAALITTANPVSRFPHHALFDALALKEWVEQNEVSTP